MYQALYRKWRPNSFDDVVGQEHITETLKRQLVTGRLSHAYLFVGTRGTGKTTCAKILARAANCEHPVNGNPCNRCPSCVGIETGAILDVEELDAASNNSVDNIRALRDEAVFTPAAVKKRVYIVDEVHMLSTAAFNALLKILEEPPEHLIFILATTEIRKVPATILSRCQRFSFKRISPLDIANRLLYISSQESFTLLPDAAQLLARLADGSMRDALSLLDQCASAEEITVEHVLSAIGLAGSDEIGRMLGCVIDGDVVSVLESLDKMYFAGRDMASVLKELTALLRDILLSKVAPKGSEKLLSGNFTSDVIKRFAAKIPTEKIMASLQALQQAVSDMTFSQDKKITAEMCLIKLCDSSLSQDYSALISRIAVLENKIKNGSFQVSSSETVEKEEKMAVKAESASQRADDIPPWEDAAAPTAKAEERKTMPTASKPKAASEFKPTAAAGFDSTWQEILKIAEKKMDIAPFSFLSDKMHCNATLEDGCIYIKAKNPFALQMLDTAAVTNAVKNAAETVLGSPVAVKAMTDDSQAELKTDKLDALKKFKNIKFE